MSATWLALPIAVPLIAAAVLALTPGRTPLRRAVALTATAVVLGFGVLLLIRTHDGTVLSSAIGDWTPGVAIMFAADQLSALLVTVTAVLVLACLGFGYAAKEDSNRLFSPLALTLSAGVYGAYLTADLFNLFVFVEVMLAPSYVLIVLARGPRQIAAGRIYLAVSLLASTVFLAGIGLLYGVTGTVNLGELAGAARGSGPVAIAGGVVLIAMAIKAGVVPVHTWLPRTYPFASPAVVALFSGLLTKVGVYAIIRIYAVVYDGDQRYAPLLLAVALLSMVVGAIGAIGQHGIRSVLIYSMVSHVGFILIGPALATSAGLTAAIFYLVQYVLVKAALLLCSGAISTTYGTDRLLLLGGLVGRAPLLSVVFMVSAMSLAGVPPLSGFVAKLSLVQAAIEQQEYLAAGLVVGVGLLTILAMVKVWNGAFWGHNGAVTWAEEGEGAVRTRTTIRAGLVAPAVVLAIGSLALGIGAEPLLTAARVAADGLVDPSGYVAAVMPR